MIFNPGLRNCEPECEYDDLLLKKKLFCFLFFTCPQNPRNPMFHNPLSGVQDISFFLNIDSYPLIFNYLFFLKNEYLFALKGKYLDLAFKYYLYLYNHNYELRINRQINC
jgi:hypothetical protein